MSLFHIYIYILYVWMRSWRVPGVLATLIIRAWFGSIFSSDEDRSNVSPLMLLHVFGPNLFFDFGSSNWRCVEIHHTGNLLLRKCSLNKLFIFFFWLFPFLLGYVSFLFSVVHVCDSFCLLVLCHCMCALVLYLLYVLVLVLLLLLCCYALFSLLYYCWSYQNCTPSGNYQLH